MDTRPSANPLIPRAVSSTRASWVMAIRRPARSSSARLLGTAAQANGAAYDAAPWIDPSSSAMPEPTAPVRCTGWWFWRRRPPGQAPSAAACWPIWVVMSSASTFPTRPEAARGPRCCPAASCRSPTRRSTATSAASALTSAPMTAGIASSTSSTGPTSCWRTSSRGPSTPGASATPACRAVKDDIVYVSISGWGQYGPWSDRPGYDPAALAAGGWMSLNGAVEGHPTKAPTFLADDLAGLHAALSAPGRAAPPRPNRRGPARRRGAARLGVVPEQRAAHPRVPPDSQQPRWGSEVSGSVPTSTPTTAGTATVYIAPSCSTPTGGRCAEPWDERSSPPPPASPPTSNASLPGTRSTR